MQNKYYEAVNYVDSMLNQFLIAASKTKWFKNTLIFITSDTSNYQNPQKPFSNFEDFVKTRSKIPLLIIGGNIKKALPGGALFQPNRPCSNNNGYFRIPLHEFMDG